MVRSNLSARSRKEGTQGAVAILREKKSPRLYISELKIQWILFYGRLENDIERFSGTHHETLRMHLVQNWTQERKGESGGIIQKGEPHERNPCAPGFEEWTPEGASRQADCDSKIAWNLARKTHNAEQGRFKLRWTGILRGEGPETRQRDRAVTEKRANKRGRTSYCSRFRSVRNNATARWNASGSIASYTLLETRILIWVNNGETPRLANGGESISCTMDNFVLLVVPRLSSIPAAVCLQHQDQQISKIISEMWYHYQIQPRLEVTSMHAWHRCWQILTSRPRETVNQQTKNFSDEMYKEDPTQDILDWLQPFTLNLEDLKYMCSHILLKEWTQIWKATLQKWR